MESPADRSPFAALRLAAVALVGLACAAWPVPGFVALLAGGAIAAAGLAPRGSHAAGQWLLKGSVVALGAGIDLSLVVRAGLDGLGAAATTLVAAIVAGALLAKWLRIERDAAWLITVGTAICGGSAIAAAAPVLRAKPAAVGVAIGVVFLLNAVALLLFPWLGDALGLDAAQFGEWCALAIHDTSSVVGAAATRGREALELATVMKLGRSLWIVPVCIALAFLPEAAASRGAASSVGNGGAKSSGADRLERLRRRPIWLRPPLFVLAFVAAAALVALVPALAPIGQSIAALGKRGLIVALFAVGLSIDRATLRTLQWRHLGLGIVLWLLLATVAWCAVV
ncbi:MAG: putative sulfate exporter family transporter [Planctomycetes bacterium]|nr:putative sulfate exporter family transporter [Planctomycetota bacterium]